MGINKEVQRLFAELFQVSQKQMLYFPVNNQEPAVELMVGNTELKDLFTLSASEELKLILKKCYNIENASGLK